MSTSSIQTVDVEQLTVDPRVQRQLDVSRVRRLAADWDPDMDGVITVSHRVHHTDVLGFDSTEVREEFVILDGQTRAAAAEQAGVRVLTAEVFENLTEAEEAALFLKHNDRKAVTPRDRFRLSVVAQDEDALRLRDIAARHGWYVQGAPPADLTGMRAFQAISAAEKVYAIDGGKALRKAFHVIDAAWGRSSGAVCSETLYGIGLLYAENPTGIDTSGLVAKLAKLGLFAHIAAIGDRRRTHPGMSIKAASQGWTVDLYNRGRRTHRV